MAQHPDLQYQKTIKDWSIKLPVDITLDEANPDDYDAIVVPGGVINPDK